jgi:hypothetical protein
MSKKIYGRLIVYLYYGFWKSSGNSNGPSVPSAIKEKIKFGMPVMLGSSLEK